MQSTKISSDVQKRLGLLLDTYPIVRKIVNSIAESSGRPFLVGGAIRDLLLGLPVKDLDIEVHGMQPHELESVLKQYGPVSVVGKVFGVLRLHGLDVDWSLPRVDEPGRKPEVHIDPEMKIEQALRRRDLTMNALALNLVTDELIDPFGGVADMKSGMLRAPDAACFVEDPLRFYRVMQFVGRFEMGPDEQLNSLCAEMDLSTVSVERIEQEFKKLLLRSKKPSLGIRWLKQIGRLDDLFPELAALVDLPQPVRWHPEGDAFEHTMQVVDAAAALEYASDEQKLTVMLAALCHDLGKATTTEKVKGEWRSYGHPQEGVKPTKQLLKRITRNKELIAAVATLVRHHMAPVQFVEDGAGPSAYKRLANKLAPHVTMGMLAKLSLADQFGRVPEGKSRGVISDERIDQFLRKAEQLHVVDDVEKPIVRGRDLIDVIPPGPELGESVKKAYRIQIDEGLQDKEILIQRVLDDR